MARTILTAVPERAGRHIAALPRRFRPSSPPRSESARWDCSGSLGLTPAAACGVADSVEYVHENISSLNEWAPCFMELCAV